MKWLNCIRIRLVLVGCVTTVVFGGGLAKADFTFGEPTNLGPIVNSSDYDSGPCISADGLTLYFHSPRPNGYGEKDLWMTRRETIDDPWGEPENLGATINSLYNDHHPNIFLDGLSLCFNSLRPGGSGDSDIWMSSRATKDDPWSTPINLGSSVNSSGWEGNAFVSNDGLTLMFNSDRPGGYGNKDLWVTRRPTTNDDWGEPANLGPIVNSSEWEAAANISPCGKWLFFASRRPGGFGDGDIWMANRPHLDAEWGMPVNLGPIINTSFFDGAPNISADGYTLYMRSTRPGGCGSMDIWQAPIIPIVDFNGDGNIDTDDLLIMIDNWGTDDSTCDIGPMPWGDGVVDMNDLEVFIEYWEQFNEPLTGENMPEITEDE